MEEHLAHSLATPVEASHHTVEKTDHKCVLLYVAGVLQLHHPIINTVLSFCILSARSGITGTQRLHTVD